MDAVARLLDGAPDGYEVVWSRRPLVASDFEDCAVMAVAQIAEAQIAEAFRIPVDIIGRIEDGRAQLTESEREENAGR